MAQTILVTGSTSGFGRLTVETLARQGYRFLRACARWQERMHLRQKNYALWRNENILPCIASKSMSRLRFCGAGNRVIMEHRPS